MTRKWLWFSCIFSVLFFVQLSPFNFRDFLEKGLKKLETEIAAQSKKLTDKNFLAKAPENIVDKVKQKYEALSEKRDKLETSLQRWLEI